jgi:fatty acid desaturase
MHLQIVWRPVFVRSQRRYLKRSLGMLAVRGTLLVALAVWNLRAFVLYLLAYGLLLHVLNFFDAWHHTFEQIFVEADEPVPPHARSRAYEEENTYSNVISVRHPCLNVLTLNFGYHNAHHQRASVPWYRLPRFHESLYQGRPTALMPLSELLVSWHRNRVRRVRSDGAGPTEGPGRCDGFIGGHGVSFLTVM